MAPKGRITLRQKDRIRTNPRKGALGATDEANLSGTETGHAAFLSCAPFLCTRVPRGRVSGKLTGALHGEQEKKATKDRRNFIWKGKHHSTTSM